MWLCSFSAASDCAALLGDWTPSFTLEPAGLSSTVPVFLRGTKPFLPDPLPDVFVEVVEALEEGASETPVLTFLADGFVEEALVFEGADDLVSIYYNQSHSSSCSRKHR